MNKKMAKIDEFFRLNREAPKGITISGKEQF